MVKRPAAKSDAMPLKDQIMATTLSPYEILPNAKLYQDLCTLDRYKYFYAGGSAGGGLSSELSLALWRLPSRVPTARLHPPRLRARDPWWSGLSVLFFVRSWALISEMAPHYGLTANELQSLG